VRKRPWSVRRDGQKNLRIPDPYFFFHVRASLLVFRSKPGTGFPWWLFLGYFQWNLILEIRQGLEYLRVYSHHFAKILLCLSNFLRSSSMGSSDRAPANWSLSFSVTNKIQPLANRRILYWDFFSFYHQKPGPSQFFEQWPGISAHATINIAASLSGVQVSLNLPVFCFFPCRILDTEPDFLIPVGKKRFWF